MVEEKLYLRDLKKQEFYVIKRIVIKGVVIFKKKEQMADADDLDLTVLIDDYDSYLIVSRSINRYIDVYRAETDSAGLIWHTSRDYVFLLKEVHRDTNKMFISFKSLGLNYGAIEFDPACFIDERLRNSEIDMILTQGRFTDFWSYED